uniref:Uncharacterized protein n=1 Tax=Dicentrarchus labrax TaxID=13489 RepID=A0A8C4I752_DICLA
ISAGELQYASPSNSHLLACIPSPCRGSAHLGRHSTTEQPRHKDCWKRP